MVDAVKEYDTSVLLRTSRAFSHFLALSNSAENHHRVRRLRERALLSGSDLALPAKEDSCGGSIRRLLNQGVSGKEIMETMIHQSVEIVLTGICTHYSIVVPVSCRNVSSFPFVLSCIAHPTEVNRRTMLTKHQRIREILEMCDRTDLSQYDRRELDKGLMREISCLWESDELKRTKPTPVDEAKSGIAIVENVLWHAVPSYLRKLNDVFVKEIGTSLPLTIAPIKISSWMGGDRDGNPNVTPAITQQVCLLSRWMAATLYKEDIRTLRLELSINSGSAELAAYTNGAYEPYRHVLKGIENRLQATIEWTELQLKPGATLTSKETPLLNNAELMEPLLLIHRSLIDTNNSAVADGNLINIIRKVAVFGLQLMAVDIRQESHRHTEALDAITNFLGMGSYKKWDESARRKWLEEQIASKRPLLSRGKKLSSYNFSPTVLDTLSTFELISTLESDSLGAYVISQCQQASDVMAVALLQIDAGVSNPLRVVPLFETLDDLERSSDTIDALFSSPVYRGLIHDKHEIMVGYSDSAKDAGRLAATWAQYNAQVAMMEVSNKHKVEVTFFHGKGGTVGRGGNPALFKAILAHPPHTINGRFRVTEQGEMITQNFGSVSIAERTLDVRHELYSRMEFLF
jgi:phosphoenolpyruvate carboxylase